jgi:uncharacterized RDD family membrane protein YckC
VALLLDSLIQGLTCAILLVVWLLVMGGFFGLFSGHADAGSFVMDVSMAIGIIAFFLVTVGYFIFYEALRNGQTPGKRIMGVRVVRDEGTPIDFSSAVIRNLIRLIEVMALPVIGVVAVLASSDYKRLGDYAAGTMVVKERVQTAAVPQARPIRLNPEAAPEAEQVRDVDLLTRDELAAVRRFVERRRELDAQVQEIVAKQIAEPIMVRLGIQKPTGDFSYGNFLEETLRRCLQDRGVL